MRTTKLLFVSKRFVNLSLRNFSVELYLRRDDETLVSQVSDLLRPPETQWDAERLRTLLFSGETPRKPFLHIARRLESSSKALEFFNFLRANSEDSPSLSAVFQGALELAAREPRREERLAEICAMARELNVSLTVNAATLLMERFARAGMVEELRSVFDGLEASCRNSHVRNKMVWSLLRLGRFEEAVQVLDEMLDTNADAPPNKVTGKIVFPVISERSRDGKRLSDEDVARLVLQLGFHGVFPGPIELKRVITNLWRNGKVSLAAEVFYAIVEAGEPVGVESCNALLTGFAKSRDLKRMNELMAKMKEREIRPSVITFGILIDYLCKSRRVDEALEMLGMMREEGSDRVKPDVIIYNALIDGLCKVARQNEGLNLLNEMRSGSVCKPNAATYNCLIDGFNKIGEIKTAIELFDRMKNDNVTPNIITLNTVIDAMCRHGRVNSAVVLFDEMRRDGAVKPNAFTYTTLIATFCSVNNIAKAMELFSHMETTGCPCDAVVYYSLIAGLSRAGRMNDACDVVTKLKAAGFGLDTVAYNVMIAGFCNTNKLDKAYEALVEMEEAGVKPDTVTYNTLIGHLGKKGSLDIAHDVLGKMLNDGFAPDIVTYGALIHGYCVAGEVDEAVRLFREMNSRSKVAPNTVIYNVLISALCKGSKVDSALDLMEEMRGNGVKPNAATFNALLKGLRLENSLEKALGLMDLMVEEACDPDFITMEVLTDWLAPIGKIEKLKQFLKRYDLSKTANL